MEMTISRFLNLRVAGGYQGLSFDNSSSTLANKVNNASDNSDLNSYYANLTLAHRLNRFVTETLAAGRETQSGLQTNYQITDYVRYTANVRMLRDITTGFTFFYDHDTLSSRANPETIDRYGAGVNVSYQLTRKASVSAGYQFIIKDSSLIDNSYNQNRFFLSVHSDF